MYKFIYLLPVVLAGCAVGPDYEKPVLDLPQEWPGPVENANATIDQKWWQKFNDPMLNDLIAEGLASGKNLLIAAARIEQARATLSFHEAEQLPSLKLQGSATRLSNSSETTFFGKPLSRKPENSFELSTVLNYEVDLWGKFRRASESAEAQFLASQANCDAIRLGLVSDIASSYFNLLALDAQLQVTQETIKSRQESSRYNKLQHQYGVVDSLISQQADSELSAALAALPLIQQQRQEQETALAILLGRSPKALVENKLPRGPALDKLSPALNLPNNVPSTLLTRRPDIWSAEQALIAANADIGIVQADYFPTISLSALLGLGSTQIDRLLRKSARTWQLAGTVAGPIIDMGRTSANVDGATAQKEIAFINYQQVVSGAFKEVVDALSATQTSSARVTALEKQAKAYDKTLHLVQQRYQAGYSNYLEVLDAQRHLYQAQMDKIMAKRQLHVAYINLCKALGGGWQVAPKPT